MGILFTAGVYKRYNKNVVKLFYMKDTNSKKDFSCIKRINKYRVVTALLFVALICLGAIFFRNQQLHNQTHFNKKYPFIDPTRNFLDQKDFITNIQPLREKLNSLVQEQGLSDSVSLYFEVLNTGSNISINNNKKIFPASLTKLPLGIATAKKIDDGFWKWDTKLTIHEEDLDQNSGYLYQRGAGTEISVEELVKELLINSDNTAYKVLLRNVETKRLVDMVSALGLEDLFEKDGKMSAKEYTRFFRTLYYSSYLTMESSQKILDCLSKSHFDEYLTSGLPKDILFANKIGENYMYNSYSDAGIVYVDNRPYIIVLMYETKNGAEDKKKVTDFMKLVSSEVFNYIKNY